jgi:CheY-like chemotaxis protein
MIKIIYIDDEANSEKLDSKFDLLLGEGIQIIPVAYIKDALPVIKKNIDVIKMIIIDLIMPPYNYYNLEETTGGTLTGIRLLKDIREKYSDIPIMIVSVNKRETCPEDKLKEYKVAEYLEKPVSASEIADKIKLVLRQT